MSPQKFPNLIIAGVNKAGTTSLHTYLSWHADIGASTIKETNYFVPLLYDNDLPPIDSYVDFFKNCNKQSRYLMESTPRYIYGGDKMARTINEKLGLIKIIFLLRDPITRLFSYYKHMKDTEEIPENMLFDGYVNKSLTDLEGLMKEKDREYIDVYAENVYVRGLAQGFYSNYLPSWYNVFEENVQICFFEDLKINPTRLMYKICNWLEIDPTVYQSAKFTVENKRIRYKNKILHIMVSNINEKFENYFRTHNYLKEILRNIYYSLNESMVKQEVISDESLEKLEVLYSPYNKKLFEMLPSKGYSHFPEWLKKS